MGNYSSCSNDSSFTNVSLVKHSGIHSDESSHEIVVISEPDKGRNDRLLLIGDKAQLPPVGEEESPALSASMLQGYGLSVYECDLNEVVRQSQQSHRKRDSQASR